MRYVHRRRCKVQNSAKSTSRVRSLMMNEDWVNVVGNLTKMRYCLSAAPLSAGVCVAEVQAMSTVTELDLAIQEVDALLSHLLKGSDPKQLSLPSVQQSKPST